MPQVNTPVSEAEIATMLIDYAAGMTTYAIARKLDRVPGTVRKQVRDAGLTRHSRGIAHERPELVRRFATLMEEGHGLKGSARKVNTEAGTSFAYTTYRAAMRTLGLKLADSQIGGPAPEPKTEVIFEDLVIRVVPSTEYEHVGESAFAPVSLSAGVRVLEVAA